MSFGTYPPATTPVQYGDSASLDAFSRVRTAHAVGTFAVQQQYNNSPYMLEVGSSGTGTTPAYNTNTRMSDFVVGAGTGTSFLQSYEYIPYQPGKSQLVFATFVLGAGSASCIKDVGLFDASNGIFLRQNGTSGLQLIRRTKISGSVVDNTVEQAAWNINPLPTLDATKAQILVIDAQFLGMGRVRVGFDIGGVIVYVHQFLHANVLTVPYMQTLSLPVQMLMSTTSAAGTCSFKCASVSAEGGLEHPNSYSFATPSMTVSAGSATATHLVSLRPATTYNTITNRIKIAVHHIDILVTGNYPVYWQLCIGSTFSAAPTWTAVDATSAAEYTSTVGTLSAAGLCIEAGYIAATNQNSGAISADMATKYPISLDRAGAVRAAGTYSLIVTGLGGASATYAVMHYTEIR